MRDSNSVDDWSLTDDTTPGKPNNEVPPPETSATTIPTKQTSATAVAVPKPATKKAASTTRTSTTSKSSTTKSIKSYRNGDLSNDIVISEILPHAESDDRNNEWIELTNRGSDTINMGNWQVDDAEGGSKPYVLGDSISIAPQSTYLIKASDSKLSLNNTKDQVRLFDPTGKLLQTVEYDEAPKAQSYANILISKEDGSTDSQWIWENQPTPGQPNPVYLELSGEITSDADFGDTYSFPLRTDNGTNYTVTFDESLLAGPLAKATFVKGSQIKILATDLPSAPEASTSDPANAQSSSTQQQTNNLILKKYEIIGSSPASDTNASPWYYLGLIPPGGAGFWYVLQKIKKIYGKI